MAQITLLTGPQRRRRWSDENRERILAAAFAPGAVVADIARQFEVSTSLVYKWREQALAVRAGAAFTPAVLAAEAPPVSAPLDATAILVELASGTQLKIGTLASPELATAALRGLALIPIASGVRISIATGHTDMRRGMNGLARQVQEGPGRDPFAGDVFVFRGRSGSLIKAPWHDGTGSR